MQTRNNGNHTSLDKPQAIQACTAFGHLKGVQIQGNGIQGIVECVAVAPFDDINKWIFLEHYAQHKDAVKAMNFYHVPFFDVVLIVKNNNDAANGRMYTYVSLHTYLHQQNIRLDYTALKTP